MHRIALSVAILALAQPALAQAPLRLTYRTYALGLPVAEAAASIDVGEPSYALTMSYRTIGLARLVSSGWSASAVAGSWVGDRPSPRHYDLTAIWRGQERAITIDYAQGIPSVRQLLPALESDREIVPESLRAGSTDTLTALTLLIRTVAKTGRCDTSTRTFDGRRAAEIVASTVGSETLDATGRSRFAGPALRCAFVSRVLAGFRADDADRSDYRPLVGAAWLATVDPAHPSVPVRLAVETRWFGEATSYLTGIETSGRQ